MGTSTIEEEDVLIEKKRVKKHKIILYNDDHNTFIHVINCLVKYCKHDNLQAEQCATIVHHNGKCSVKEGEYNWLKPICTALTDQGLSAQIE